MNLFENLFKFKIDNQDVVGLNDELKCIYIWNLFSNSNDSILFVVNSLYEASNFYQKLSNYTNDCLFFPMDDFLTSEALAISPELKIRRLETLKELVNSSKKIVITNLMGYLRYLPSKETFTKNKIILKINEDYNIKDLIEKLFKLGYTKETIVNKTGDISVRGFVLDIFPTNTNNPIRIEYWGDTIESIKEFDVDNQLTINSIKEIVIYPNTEFLIDSDIDTFGLLHRSLPDYTKIVNIYDYLNGTTIINDLEQIKISFALLQEEILNYNISINKPGNTKYMYDLTKLTDEKYINFSSFDSIKENIESYKTMTVDSFTGTPEAINERLNKYLKKYKKVIICVKDQYRINKIIDFLQNDNFIISNENNVLDKKINIIIKKIEQGFIFNDLVVISENELFNKKSEKSTYKTNFKIGTKIKDITKLENGDYVVHYTYGIGIYRGIKTLNKNGLKKDYLMIEYKGKEYLYIPVENIELISKYASKEGAAPKINKLNSAEWEKTKLRVKKKVESIALELLELYAKREASEGFAFLKDDDNQFEFEREFEFNETPDQIKVLNEIKKDMEKNKPMDRLVCGDVGYGKTEVAFRAMFKAILSGKQVAFLCPTTILSSQHYTNAINRFKSFPVNIKLLNRFVPTKIKNKIITEAKEGKIDLLIGTHRILSDDINFKDLGLLVIDEEQRFGVKHKEKIKKFKNNIDVLTLSATPIPRTLQLSMTGLRSLSLIETPPSNRYPIQTYVLNENSQIIKDAIYKELSRNGQVFILYNRIDNIMSKSAEISQLVPEAKIAFAHGEMEKNELENIMLKFIKKEYNVLVCTTIIETGIDIPSANTLIIIDADRFGLSQLYQLRGRVGRSNKIAYCYLMYNKHKVLSEIANKRLKTIREFTELGSGFSIAMRDLSIRGAGDILGSEQAGFIDTVGVELFIEMLNNEVNSLKGIKPQEKVKSNQPLIEVDTAIDDNYVLEEELKIEIHKKINQIDSYSKLIEVKKELEDRFGKLSDILIIYMHQEWFEKLASSLKVKDIRQSKNFVEIILTESQTNKVKAQELFMKLTDFGRMFRLSMRRKKLIITLDIIKLEKHFIYYLIDLLEIIKKMMEEK